MKKIIISNLPEQAAKEFAEERKSAKIDFSIIPRSIGSNEKFWAKLCEIDSEYIARVPEKILNSEAFAKLIDHQRFYRFIPKKFLTEDDYYAHKENPGLAVCAYGGKAEISNHDDFVWYKFRNSSSWCTTHEMTARTIINHIDELEKAKDILPELWSQELADLLWDSSLAIVSFDDIPNEFVRDEWAKIMTLLKDKRYPVFGLGSTYTHPDLLAEYWTNFRDESQMATAIELEKLVSRCSNPYGYARTYSFNASSEEVDSSECFKNLWQAIKPVVENNPNLIEEFFNMYEGDFSRVLPDDLFKIDWVKKSSRFMYYCEDYYSALDDLECAESEVEKLEAQEDVDIQLSSLKKLILSYHEMSEEQVNSLIASEKG